MLPKGLKCTFNASRDALHSFLQIWFQIPEIVEMISNNAKVIKATNAETEQYKLTLILNDVFQEMINQINNNDINYIDTTYFFVFFFVVT